MLVLTARVVAPETEMMASATAPTYDQRGTEFQFIGFGGKGAVADSTNNPFPLGLATLSLIEARPGCNQKALSPGAPAALGRLRLRYSIPVVQQTPRGSLSPLRTGRGSKPR